MGLQTVLLLEAGLTGAALVARAFMPGRRAPAEGRFIPSGTAQPASNFRMTLSRSSSPGSAGSVIALRSARAVRLGPANADIPLDAAAHGDAPCPGGHRALALGDGALAVDRRLVGRLRSGRLDEARQLGGQGGIGLQDLADLKAQRGLGVTILRRHRHLLRRLLDPRARLS